MTLTQEEATELEAQGLRHLAARPPLRVYLASMWDWREYRIRVPLGTLQARNMNTVLGNFWQLLNPLPSMAVYGVDPRHQPRHRQLTRWWVMG